jgi:hypothetical protein
LFFSELRGGIEESLEIFLLRFTLEKVNFGKELLLLTLKLLNFFLQIRWVHRLLSKGLCVQMGSLEFCLEVFVDLEGLSHVLVHELLVRDG